MSLPDYRTERIQATLDEITVLLSPRPDPNASIARLLSDLDKTLDHE
jgi:hypothetical protein